jgi:hypothetical protein
MKKVRRGVFGCPHCHAEFRHNFKRWALALPVMLVVTVGLFHIAPGLGIWVIAGGLLSASLIARRAPEYLVDTPGDSVAPQIMTQEQKESTFFKVAIFCFLLIVTCALGWSLVYLLRFLLR